MFESEREAIKQAYVDAYCRNKGLRDAQTERTAERKAEKWLKRHGYE